jgi:Cof subfamily protein (haloacid dehalogenase superfamily)
MNATIYVSDLDGTLLDDDGRLSERTRKGLAALLDGGLKLTVASARSVVAMQSILAGLRLPLPVVEFNGGFISDLESGRHLVTNALTSGDARAAFDIVLEEGRMPFVSTFDGAADRLYYERVGNAGMQWYVDDRIRSNDGRLTRTDALSDSLREQVVCLTVIDRAETIAGLQAGLLRRLGDRVVVRRCTNECSPGWDWLTVQDRMARKDLAVEAMLELQGLEGAEVVAFGDSDNDLPLLRMARRGVAVANASQGLKAGASLVIGPNSEDSVVGFLEEEYRATTR